MTLGKKEKITVTLYDEEIGQMSEEAGRYFFQYDPSYEHHPISLSLPIHPSKNQKKKFKALYSGNLPHYFSNLLPEGWLLSKAKELGGYETSSLQMLHNFCQDSIGAVSFKIAGKSPPRLDPIISEHNIEIKTDRIHCFMCGARIPKGFNGGFHESCSMQLFDSPKPFQIALDNNKLSELAKAQLLRGQTITGAQVKLSLLLQDLAKTIVEKKLSYIIKPQMSDGDFSDLPQMEHITMRFADRLGLDAAISAVIQTIGGRNAFITKRFDRTKTGKIHVEDMAQATATSKGDHDLNYNGSYELIGKLFKDNEYTTSKENKESKTRLLNSLIFNYLVGNTDAHLKNHSIIWNRERQTYKLSPFYDLVPNKLYCNDKHHIGIKLKGKNLISRSALLEYAESLDLKASKVDDFLYRFKSERTWYMEQLHIFGIKHHRIERMMSIIGHSIRLLNEKEGIMPPKSGRQAPSNDRDDLRRLSTEKPQSFSLCQRKPCSNPGGAMRLRGDRKKYGVCSKCEPDKKKLF